MKLKSKEQCPISVRDRLVARFAELDVGILDMKLALEIAEKQCFELDKKNKIWLKALSIKEELNESLRGEIEDLKDNQ